MTRMTDLNYVPDPVPDPNTDLSIELSFLFQYNLHRGTNFRGWAVGIRVRGIRVELGGWRVGIGIRVNGTRVWD